MNTDVASVPLTPLMLVFVLIPVVVGRTRVSRVAFPVFPSTEREERVARLLIDGVRGQTEELLEALKPVRTDDSERRRSVMIDRNCCYVLAKEL